MGLELEELTAARVRGIKASGIRKIFDQAATLADPLNLSIGRPDFDVSDAVKEAACAAIREGFNQYTPSGGIPELKNAIRADYFARHQVKFDEVLVTSGVSGALTLALSALVDPGDEVLVPDPYFVSYRHLTVMCGGVPIFYDTYPNFRVRPEEVERLITPRTKVLLLVSPANPTGACLDERTKGALAEIAARRGLVVVADEIYDRFIYDGGPNGAARVRPFATYYPEGTLTVSGLSKTAAMTGWRLGWACGPRALIEAMTKLQQFTFVCAPSIVQWAALRALKEEVAPKVAEYRGKRDLMVAGLREAGYEVEPPPGAFYLFVRAPDGYENSTAFIEAALKKNLLLVPGNVFSERDTHFRISYAASDATLRRALKVFAELNRR